MKLIPKSFLWRTLLMVFVPLVIALTIVASVFFDNHWKRVHGQMARSLASEITAIIKEPAAAAYLGINVSQHERLSRPRHSNNNSREAGQLAEELRLRLGEKALIYIDRPQRLLYVDILQNGKITTFATSLKRIYSDSTEVFLAWMIAAVLIVGILILPFILIHTQSITKIAKAANKFGRGLDMPEFKPSGSREIRVAAQALITMKERLNRYNRTRTDMLNAVSHDLKSPLTRMRLAVETDSADKGALLHDIDRMAEMVSGYLAFARGETPEIEQEISLPPMLTRIARDAADGKEILTNFQDAPAMFYARPLALARAFGNIIENAARHAKKKVAIAEKDSEDEIEITIDDDGNGIPADKRAEALRPFVRLDAARGKSTGGTGLGLSIAQTAIENHGGQIFLEDSPLGGLRVRVVLPV